MKFIDDAIENWTKQYPLKMVQKILDDASVPVGPIYGIKEIVNDEHYKSKRND